MRAAELIAPLEFRLAEMPIEDPGPGEIQVHVESIGVCGSDLHAYTEGQVGGMPNAYPMVLGHEPAGVIVKVGAGVTGLSAGDRGALEPAIYCYHCEFCMSGHHNVCANIRFLSTPNIPGFFREYVNLPAANFLPIPAAVSYDTATLAEPLAIAIHSLRLSSIAANETIAVIGAGPIGLTTIAALRAAKAKRIWAIEPLAYRRELALKMGADVALEPGEAVAEVMQQTGKRGVDCVFDCCAGAETVPQAIQMTRNAGRVVLTGIHSTPTFTVDASGMRRKEIVLYNVRRSNHAVHESHEALDLLMAQPDWFAPLVTHARPLDRIGEAFDLTSHYRDGVGKMVIRP